MIKKNLTHLHAIVTRHTFWRLAHLAEDEGLTVKDMGRIRDGKLVSEAGTRERDGWWKVYGTRVKKILCWQPMPEPPDLTEWDEWMEAQEQEE